MDLKILLVRMGSAPLIAMVTAGWIQSIISTLGLGIGRLGCSKTTRGLLRVPWHAIARAHGPGGSAWFCLVLRKIINTATGAF
ncbi:hypothetical protein B0H17DRAFT_1037795 [Mycena rosella]|uniref:Uncharacterized protein n=1 Tax=Mycena rosella TaxID=1033263 RepID=A0AAD7GU50_MYCRO|nr:hypothetical protein B0H17DRAFT_1037795 [Mycena rosella]